MKSFELLLATIVVACVGFSFTHQNNFAATSTAATKVDKDISTYKTVVVQQNDADTLSEKELLDYIGEELITPIRDCFMEKDPHMFMTKCYTRIYFEPNKRYKYEKFYKNSRIDGSLVLIDCSVENRMADIQIDYANKTIKVKESFTSPIVTKDKYLKDLCNYVKKNGIPNSF